MENLYCHLAWQNIFLYNDYNDRIKQIEIISNGSVLPSDNVITSLKQWKDSIVLVDNYGESLSSKIKEISRIFDENRINYSVRDYYSEELHCGGWVDFGNVAEKKHSLNQAKELYLKCAYPKKINLCFTIFDHIVYPCPPVGH